MFLCSEYALVASNSTVIKIKFRNPVWIWIILEQGICRVMKQTAREIEKSLRLGRKQTVIKRIARSN